jgi:hypothetical protein
MLRLIDFSSVDYKGLLTDTVQEWYRHGYQQGYKGSSSPMELLTLSCLMEQVEELVLMILHQDVYWDGDLTTFVDEVVTPWFRMFEEVLDRGYAEGLEAKLGVSS